MDIPQPPPLVDDEVEQDALDRAWVKALTAQIAVELERVNHSKMSWTERTMIWKGRSLVYAEKQRQVGEALVKPTYAQSVLAARRLRAGWEYMAHEQPKETETLAKACEDHFATLEQRGLRPMTWMLAQNGSRCLAMAPTLFSGCGRWCGCLDW